MNCKSCFTSVDKRSAVKCTECSSLIHKECVITFGGASLCDVCFTVQEEKPKSKFGDFELPEFIRRTYIETYRKCPYKFYQEVIQGHKMPPNCYTQVGSDLHELFEYAIAGQIKVASEMKMLFETRYWNTYDDELFEMKSRESMWERAMDSIDTFFTILPRLNNVFAVEETIQFPVGVNLPLAQITMDLITENDGELEMHDWKTGKVMVGQKLSTDLQAPLYIYAVREKYGKPVKSFEFYYLQENKTRKFIRSEIDPNVYICTVGKREYKVNVMDAIREVQSIFSHIKKGNFQPKQDNKDRYFIQKTCHLKELGLCCQDIDPWSKI